MTDNEARSRYEISVDGHVVGSADYQRTNDRVVLPHTIVTPSMRGRGLAAILVQHALDEARTWGCTVVPVCWYVAQYVDEHPEYADLLDATGTG
ncbi:MAG: GNAT family N-acetyltransferase [Acidimicrobiia bacterium]